MSKDYQVNLPAHPNIYNKNSKRDFNIYFSEPENGVNEDTGFILFIPGFGGNAHSNVYKKMRSKFADEYNLITVQCDYFGQEFMQGSNIISFNLSKESLTNTFSKMDIAQIFANGFDPKKFIEVGSHFDINVPVKEVLNESIENFNDMGIMQAIDNITALTYVIEILKDNNLMFNLNKVMLFGQSQGAYISYLCNAFAPSLFTLLIDNSSWLFPAYLKGSRYLFTNIGKMTMQTEFSYLATSRKYDEELLYLPTLYNKIHNNCKIECFHGTTDNLIGHIEKREFCNQITNCTYMEIDQSRVDGEVFKSTNHGLDADFLKIFDLVYKGIKFDERKEFKLEPVEIKTNFASYHIDYITGVPVLEIVTKED